MGNTVTVDALANGVAPHNMDEEANADPTVGDAILTEEGAKTANIGLVDHMFQVLEDGRCEGKELRNKLKYTYWLLVILTTLLFLVGLALISVPIWGPFLKSPLQLETMLTAAGLGIADFMGLYLFNPLARIQKLMGDISQITVIYSAFQIRVALHLVETDNNERPTMGNAAEHVHKVATETLREIESYFEKWLATQLKQMTLRQITPDA